MKSPEEIAKRTPLSITTTDNPICRIRNYKEEPYFEVLVKGANRKDGEMVKIYPGQEFRLIHIGCGYGKESSWFRYGRVESILIPNKCFDKVYGHVVEELDLTELEEIF